MRAPSSRCRACRGVWSSGAAGELGEDAADIFIPSRAGRSAPAVDGAGGWPRCPLYLRDCKAGVPASLAPSVDDLAAGAWPVTASSLSSEERPLSTGVSSVLLPE